MQSLGLNLAINSLSFGQLSTLILRVLYEREKLNDPTLDLYLFPIGQIDLSSQKKDEGFERWIQSLIIKGIGSWKRDFPCVKLWHMSDCNSSYTNKTQTLISFYELDSPQKAEITACKNNRVLFTSEYTVNLFKSFGCDNVHYLPPVFDSYNFQRIEKRAHGPDKIAFSLNGKFERRKWTSKVIKTWIKKYGNNPKFVLQCSVFNPFLIKNNGNQVIDYNNQFIAEALEGKEKPYNVVFYPNQPLNSSYNQLLNAADIVLSVGGGEGIDLPSLSSTAMGKYPVVLNCNGYRSWATKENAVLIDPNGKEDIYDNVHFFKGQPFNQGQIFSFDENQFIAGCEEAIKRFQANPINVEGLKLKDQFTPEKFVDNILKLTLE